MSNASKDALDLLLQERKREAYERIGKPATVYYCPYCSAVMPSGEEPSQWSHCHEVGHAVPEGVPYPLFCFHPDKCRGTGRCQHDPVCNN